MNLSFYRYHTIVVDSEILSITVDAEKDPNVMTRSRANHEVVGVFRLSSTPHGWLCFHCLQKSENINKHAIELVAILFILLFSLPCHAACAIVCVTRNKKGTCSQ